MSRVPDSWSRTARVASVPLDISFLSKRGWVEKSLESMPDLCVLTLNKSGMSWDGKDNDQPVDRERPEKGSLIKWRRRGICGRWNATHHSESCLDTRRITDDMIYSNKGRADY
ncbi:hypothetical protein FGSG_12794 [Fusarium graminearum PH-1]|uniref:Chromosome 3, complete genome n=1 Tax=Gibberella zeae (strain ATCC MYA-4620 / CBS 123657 / FGSC 9075 / NRRL 31084 / PH-1) TaxID=229533 RepID=I1S7H1_GIBZE|nr:hypothetical protein FGSG_12794 [Fusarium graminearum PH-1]ESU11725.1 hypothetical protein FGSG_12794 [Fusarium graminearum PH-1]CEF88532.1 unnamed protein product [Fusarium graminearum]|eukprot:XP_011324301.1 hypothetical protein FGSG_12794 [Fusarium graminearum PH-1]